MIILFRVTLRDFEYTYHTKYVHEINVASFSVTVHKIFMQKVKD